MRRVWALLLLGWALASAGCFLALSFDYDTSDPVVASDAGAEAAGPEGGGGSAFMTIAPAEVTLFTDAPEKAAAVDVKLERRDGFSGAVRLSALGLPAGVSTTANGIVITATATSTSVKLTVAPGTKHTKATITIHGETEGKTFDAPLAVVVRGSPGSIDTSFGDGGIAHVPIGDQPTLGQMRILADDRIVLSGGVVGKTPSLAVARLTADGAADPTFGGTGFVVGPAQAATATGLSIVSGGLLAAGEVAGKLVVVRYRDDGTIDPALDGDKPISTGTTAFRVVGVFAKAGGGIAIAGDDGFRAGVVHLDGDGGLDTKVGDGGLVQADEGESGGAALAADGTILIAATKGAGCAIYPFPAYGTAPPGVLEEISACSRANEVTIGDGGAHAVAGSTLRGIIGNDVMVGYRRLPSEGPKAAVVIGDGFGFGVALDATNRLLVTGKPGDSGTTYFFVTRIGTNDQVDTTFRLATAPIGLAMEARRVGIQRDGRIVVAGTSQDSKATKVFTVARYWP